MLSSSSSSSRSLIHPRPFHHHHHYFFFFSRLLVLLLLLGSTRILTDTLVSSTHWPPRSCPNREPPECARYMDRVRGDPRWSCASPLCCGDGQNTTILSDICPISCGFCSERCAGLKCKNFGKINYDTCTCQCQGHLGGPHCEDCTEQDEVWCTRFLPKSSCGRNGGPVYYLCPHFCGLCPDKCRGMQCQNHGILKIATCECECRGNFTGSYCEICPSEDKEFCKYAKQHFCYKPPSPKADMLIDCPHFCGLCAEQETQ